jgi:hypothetical protein
MDIAIPLIERLALGCISDDGTNDKNSGGHAAFLQDFAFDQDDS